MSCMGYSWPYPALVAPNGLISVDLGWIWVGYIQDGLLAPFGPTKIAIGVRGGVREWPKNVINQVFLAISGPGGSKWPDISGSWLDLGGTHPAWLVGTIWTQKNTIGGPKGVINVLKVP